MIVSPDIEETRGIDPQLQVSLENEWWYHILRTPHANWRGYARWLGHPCSPMLVLENEDGHG